jgi:hypothetical protein
VLDDLGSVPLDELDRLRRESRRAGMPVEHHRFLLDLERSGVDLNLGRLREPLDAVLPVDTGEARAKWGRPGCPHEPVLFVEPGQQSRQLQRPAFGRFGPVFGRPERVVADEQLGSLSRVRLLNLLGADAFVYLPALGL